MIMPKILNRWFSRADSLKALAQGVQGAMGMRDFEQVNLLLEQMEGMLGSHFGPRLAESLAELRLVIVSDRSFDKMLEFLEIDGKIMLVETIDFFSRYPRINRRSDGGMFPKDLLDFLNKLSQRLDSEKKAVENLIALMPS